MRTGKKIKQKVSISLLDDHTSFHLTTKRSVSAQRRPSWTSWNIKVALTSCISRWSCIPSFVTASLNALFSRRGWTVGKQTLSLAALHLVGFDHRIKHQHVVSGNGKCPSLDGSVQMFTFLTCQITCVIRSNSLMMVKAKLKDLPGERKWQNSNSLH